MSHAENGYQILRDMAHRVEAGTLDPMSLVGAVLRYADERDQEAVLGVTPENTADGMEFGSPDWHSFHHAGEGQHHECDYDVCVEWSARKTPAGGAR